MLDNIAAYSRKRLGVTWKITNSSSYLPNVPYFDCFERFNAPKGRGAAILTVICRVFDRMNEALCLVAVNDKLVEYYKQFGFSLVEHSGSYRLMVRVPCST